MHLKRTAQQMETEMQFDLGRIVPNNEAEMLCPLKTKRRKIEMNYEIDSKKERGKNHKIKKKFEKDGSQ